MNESAVGPIGKELFEKEQEDLLADLKDIPKKACDRRVSNNVSYLIMYGILIWTAEFQYDWLAISMRRSMSL